MWTVFASQTAMLFAQDKLVLQWDLAIAAGALIGVLALGSWAIYKAKEWRDNSAQEAPVTHSESLEHYQQMVVDGSLDPEEFARIKDRILSPPPPAATPPKDQPPDTSIRET
jgi:hypothetical protein